MQRAATCLALVAVLAASAAAPADAFIAKMTAAKHGGGTRLTAAAMAASIEEPAAAAAAAVAAPAEAPVAVVATKPAARPLMMAAKPAVAAMAAKPAAPVVAAMAAAAPAAAAAAAAPAACPPKGFDSAANFDLSRYIDGRWYTYAQRPVSYQPKDSLYCVSALYTLEDAAKGASAGVTVRNYSNRGGVNGASLGTSGAGGPQAPSRPGGPPGGDKPFSMIALPHPVGGPNSTDPATAASKLIVGPRQFLSAAPLPVLARILGPTYQVAAFDEEDYAWAIVVSGKPDVPGKDGLCKFGGDSGFWLFSREPVASAATKAAVEEAAKAKGLDTSDLVPVGQAGCKYEGAR